jgi:predicted phosphodiesterase
VNRCLTHRTDKPLKVTRVGVIGDVHTEFATLRLAVDHLSSLSVDRLLCTGDVPDGPHDVGQVQQCCALLEERSIVTVSGNHDRWLQDDEMRNLDEATDANELSAATLAFLAGLPPTVELETPAGRALLCHGIGTDDMTGVQPHDHGRALDDNRALRAVMREARYAVLISGHTHRRMVRSLGRLTIINAGTLLRDQGPCCSVVDFAARRVHFYDLADGRVADHGVDYPF